MGFGRKMEFLDFFLMDLELVTCNASSVFEFHAFIKTKYFINICFYTFRIFILTYLILNI